LAATSSTTGQLLPRDQLDESAAASAHLADAGRDRVAISPPSTTTRVREPSSSGLPELRPAQGWTERWRQQLPAHSPELVRPLLSASKPFLV